VQLDRLFPDPAAVSVDELLADLRFAELAPPERPYLALNMVSTLDGRATLAGRTEELGGEADQAMFHGLRRRVDAVMVGAETLRVERYGPIVRDPERREERRRLGLAPVPLAVVVSRRFVIPPDLPLLQDPDQRVLVVTPSDGELPDVPAQVEYERTDELGLLLSRLRDKHGVSSVLCEGGPTLNGQLLADDLVDELFLTLSPLLVSGDLPLTIVRGRELPSPVELEPVWLLRGGSDLLLRMRVER
jgi:riboflavin-specific deaminase-like protein